MTLQGRPRLDTYGWEHNGQPQASMDDNRRKAFMYSTNFRISKKYNLFRNRPVIYNLYEIKLYSAGLAPVQKPSNRGLSEEKLVYLPPKGFFNRSCRFFDLKKKLWGVPVEAKILSPRADAIKVVLHVSFYKTKF